MRLGDRYVDLVEEEGVGRVVGDLADSRFMSRKLALDRICAFASPDYLAFTVGPPATRRSWCNTTGSSSAIRARDSRCAGPSASASAHSREGRTRLTVVGALGRFLGI